MYARWACECGRFDVGFTGAFDDNDDRHLPNAATRCENCENIRGTTILHPGGLAVDRSHQMPCRLEVGILWA
jgi:hypothetical protein